MKAIPYGHQYITEEDVEAVKNALLSDYLTQGPEIEEFEKDFASFCQSRFCVMVSNGTAALHVAALALEVKPGDRVITTPITFVASANGFRYCGAEITFCDIDPDTFLMDLDKLETLLARSPVGFYKGVVVVNFAGYPVNGEKLRSIADRYKLWIVEDACHSPGASFTDSQGQQQVCGNGKYADLTVFSFHPVKHIATGEGGALTTNDHELYEKLGLYRSHGITKDPQRMEQNDGGWYYEMIDLGYNYRITDFQAALGISQLKRMAWNLQRRREIVEKYNHAFRDLVQIATPVVAADICHAYHLYVIQTDRRKELYDYLRENNIFSQVHYIPVHLMPYYKKTGWKAGDLPVAETYYSKCLSLPIYPTLTDEQLEYVIDKVISFADKPS